MGSAERVGWGRRRTITDNYRNMCHPWVIYDHEGARRNILHLQVVSVGSGVYFSDGWHGGARGFESADVRGSFPPTCRKDGWMLRGSRILCKKRDKFYG